MRPLHRRYAFVLLLVREYDTYVRWVNNLVASGAADAGLCCLTGEKLLRDAMPLGYPKRIASRIVAPSRAMEGEAMVYRPWDWRIANKQIPLKPHYPQWSFSLSKDCARFNALVGSYRDTPKCDPICLECKERNAANDYIRGVEPHDKPHYPVPAIYAPRNEWHWYWTMPTYPLRNLTIGWLMWQSTLPDNSEYKY